MKFEVFFKSKGRQRSSPRMEKETIEKLNPGKHACSGQTLKWPKLQAIGLGTKVTKGLWITSFRLNGGTSEDGGLWEHCRFRGRFLENVSLKIHEEKRFSVRTRTTDSQLLPGGWRFKTEFRRFITKISQRNVNHNDVINMIKCQWPSTFSLREQ